MRCQVAAGLIWSMGKFTGHLKLQVYDKCCTDCKHGIKKILLDENKKIHICQQEFASSIPDNEVAGQVMTAMSSTSCIINWLNWSPYWPAKSALRCQCNYRDGAPFPGILEHACSDCSWLPRKLLKKKGSPKSKSFNKRYSSTVKDPRSGAH